MVLGFLGLYLKVKDRLLEASYSYLDSLISSEV
jgi:hypothetical protein